MSITRPQILADMIVDEVDSLIPNGAPAGLLSRINELAEISSHEMVVTDNSAVISNMQNRIDELESVLRSTQKMMNEIWEQKN